MRLSLAGIVASYVLIAVLLLSLNLASRWHWGIKAVAIAITAGFFGVFFVSVTELIGWPTEARVPDHFQLHWATIVEPDKLNGLPGSIYLWVEALDENNMLAGTPRAFRVRHSRELADRIGRAKERIEQDCLNTKNPRILLCTLYVGVLEAEEIDRSWSTYTLL